MLTVHIIAIGCPSLDQRVMINCPTSQGQGHFGAVPPANIGVMRKQIAFSDGTPGMRVTHGKTIKMFNVSPDIQTMK